MATTTATTTTKLTKTGKQRKPLTRTAPTLTNLKSGTPEYRKAYRATPQGRATAMYGDILVRANNRSGRHPTYKTVSMLFTKAEWMAWAVPAITAFLAANPTETPSIDRIDVSGDYSIGNVRIISWSIHKRLKKQAKKARDLARAQAYYESIAAKQASLAPSKPVSLPSSPYGNPVTLPPNPAKNPSAQVVLPWNTLEMY